MLIFTVIDARTFRKVGRYEYDAPKTWDEAQALLNELRRTKYPARLYDLDDIVITEEVSE